jgi:urease accessory protein
MIGGESGAGAHTGVLMKLKPQAWRTVPLLIALLASAPASAHHVMDGRMPTAWWEGLLSGFGHPLMGLDHFAFLLAAALLAAGRPRAPLLLAAFVLASLVGVFLHVGLINLPAAEPVVAVSVLLFGIAVLAARPVGNAVFVLALVVAGLFHGYAFGEGIVGAERAPLVAYLVGLGIAQYAIMFGVMTVVQQFGPAAGRSLAYRATGAAIAVVGLGYLAVAMS